ncbi:MAG: EAL domain-containing protein [Campylobacterota bacterium]|nr:EAL domain-containing protein [Campylobacterota bacterium]
MENLQNIVKYSSSLKLLYVEDDAMARKSTLSILEEFFDNILVAVDGKDGVEQYRQNKIDLIITDINMPRLNGLDMIRKIREFDSEIAIFILSAYNESDFFIDSIKLDIEGYLLKPIDTKQFFSVLQKIIDKKILQDEAMASLNLLHQYQQVTDKNSIVSKTDSKGLITYANDEFCRISGYSYDELIGKSHNIIRHPDTKPSFYTEMWKVIKNKKEIWSGIVRNQAKDGSSYYVKSTIKPIMDQNGDIVEHIALRYNITDIMNPKKQLQDATNSMDECVVVIIKIENFDDTEKYYGHELSQKIENKFADKLSKIVPQECKFEKIYILGDGEYAFVKDKKECNISEENIILNLKKFQKTLNTVKIDVGEIDYDISVLISFAFGKESLENARYGIKELLKTNHDFILASNLIEQERQSAKKNIKTLKMIKKAIDNSKIISYFQPIINNKTKEIEKHESLVRLINEKNEVLSPFFFLDIAKKGKYYSQITHIVLDNSFNALKQTDKKISINLSALDIEKPQTREKLHNLLQENSKDAHRIVFELLEDEQIKDFKLIKDFVSDIKSYGAKIAIDDFGAGYSNFERLLDYQPDILKIDGSLIKNIETNSYSLSVVKTIIAFAKEQNIKIIAEYVENENIYNILSSLDVDYSQGYYFGKPDTL